MIEKQKPFLQSNFSPDQRQATRWPRVVVVGTSCSGKTTLARRMASIKNLPHIELDALHWGPNWTPTPLADFCRAVAAQAAQEAWVIDGNYNKVRDLIWPRASHLVWLNLPFIQVFRQALSRSLRRILIQEELWAGNRETIKGTFFERDSILWWVIRTHRRRRRQYRQLLAEECYRHLIVHEIHSPAQAEALLREMEAW
jgi:adenylate kinase family enzyme